MKYLLSFLLIGFTLVTFGQKENNYRKSMNDFTPEQQAVLKTKKMALSLDLNATQQKQILELNKKRAVELKKKMESHKAMMEGDQKPTTDERFNMMNNMLDTQIAHQGEMKKILNKEQYGQWKKMPKNEMMRMHKKGSSYKEYGKQKMMKSKGMKRQTKKEGI